MKVLLVRHHQSGANASGKYPKSGFHLIPLGMAYLAAALREAGVPVKVLDSQVSIRTRDEFKRAILESGANVIGITTMTDGLSGAFEAAEITRAYLPRADIVLGGAHMATYPADTLLKGCFDYGVIGEGEETIVELVEALSNDRDPSGIPGLLVKKGGSLSAFQPRERLKNIDRLPHPARDLFPNHLYRTALGRNPVTYILTSRGCPFRCTFCDHGLWGRRITFHSPRWVVQEMQRSLSMGAREIYVYDETFTLDKERVLAICDLIGKEGMQFHWVVSSRVDTVDGEMIRALRRAGCHQMRFGVETGSEDHLKKIKKGITLGQARKAFRICGEAGMETFAYFMLGLPGETFEEMEDTIQFALELNPDWVNFNILTLKPGTELFDQQIKSGHKPPDFWRGFLDGTVKENDCYHIPPGSSAQELNQMIQMAYRRFYLRPAFIRKRLKDLRKAGRVKNYLEGFLRVYSNRFIGQFANVKLHHPSTHSFL